ncbi:glycosyltransferase [Gramella sp. GC03-9]|uniref:Glycosyltransferase n=1 Tax=Christiangramia oceanisediminis TaxID=2920386 RepID=A0A9X2KZJ7_9FLAO|nr:glycosyltransferase [Gramella oceanisediminis]MCP9201119.1 glycosyltransferase [Gramella oceanisediminis]
MRTAVVILNWNGKELLRQFLPSVIQNSEEATIYVADNASTDGSVKFLKAEFPEIRIIQNSSNAGYAGGYNQALRDLDEDIFILLNSDVEVSPGWLGPILQIFEKEPQTAVVQPKILDYKKKDHFEYAGAAGGFIDAYGYPFCRGRIFQELEKDHGQYNEDAYIFWASGACLAIRKSAFREAEGLDEDFFAHQEEIDLCWRLQNMGYRIKFAGRSRIYHVGGATLANMNPMKTYLNFRNSLYLLLKNIESPKVYFIILMRMVLDGIAGVKFLTEGKWNHFFAILRAHGSFYRKFFHIHKKRKKSRFYRDYNLINSIVYEHFIQHKNKFSELKK